MACTHPYWSALQVGSQHLARQFAKHGWQVHYISAPVTPLHLPGLFNTQNEMIKRFRCAFIKKTLIHGDGSIHSHVPFSLIAPVGHPLLRNRWVTDHWHQTMIPALTRLKKSIAPNGIDLLYIDNLSYHFLIETLDYNKSMFRVMDIHEGFPGWKGRAKKLAGKIARKTHLTVYSALDLKNYVANLNPHKVTFVPNGVDCDLFRQGDKVGHRHPKLDHILDPIVLYTGMIDSRIDFRLIRFAAEKLPDVSFVFTGPLQGTKKNKGLPGNVYFTGPIPHKELPLLMDAAVAGMIPFDVNNAMELIQGIRPLKLLEYMAARLPVISAKWPELEKIDSPAWLYDKKEEFILRVNKALDRDYDEDKLFKFAIKYDWNCIFNQLISALEN